MEEFIPCRKCANVLGPKPGFVYSSKLGEWIEDGQFVKECDCHQRYRERKLAILRAKNSDIWENPPDIKDTYKGNKSIDYKNQFITYISNFKKFKDRVVYMHGPNGTQKTSLAMWGGSELLKQGWKVQYILMYKLIDLLTASFNKKEEYEIILNKLKAADLLIIDEAFAKDKVLVYKSGYQLSFIDSFLRERIDVNKKGTLFISNKKSNQIMTEGFGFSLQDLVTRNTLQTDLEFLDNYVANDMNDFSTRSIFN